MGIEVKNDVLTISAERGNKRYRDEAFLPWSVFKEKSQVACNNGVLEIKCLKSSVGEEPPSKP